MPTATSFAALGRGNGFPFCPTSVDVSGFDHWVTLAGYSKTNADAGSSVTETQIKTSLTRCVNLYWNTELVKTSVDAEASDSSSTAQINTQDFEHKIMKTASVALEPRERVCYSNLTGLQLNESTTPGAEACNAIVSFKLNPVRMYNGATTDINNFVGFGFSDLIDGLCNANHFGGLLDASVQSKVSSYLNGTTGSGTSTDPGSSTEFNKAVYDFTVNSIPFKAFNQAFMSSTTFSMSPTFVNQATKVSASDTSGTIHSDAEIDLGTNLSLSSYTYS
jgi:hypothetical protein